MIPEFSNYRRGRGATTHRVSKSEQVALERCRAEIGTGHELVETEVEAQLRSCRPDNEMCPIGSLIQSTGTKLLIEFGGIECERLQFLLDPSNLPTRYRTGELIEILGRCIDLLIHLGFSRQRVTI